MRGNDEDNATPSSSSHRPSSAVSSTSSLPPYSEAMQQTIEVSTPPSTFEYGAYNAEYKVTSEGASVQQPTAPRPLYEEQLNTISNLAKQPLQHGASWYVLPRSWWRLWSTVCARASGIDIPKQPDKSGGDEQDLSEDEAESSLGAISTTLLLDVQSGALRQGLQEEIDFFVVPQEAWSLLVSWYGLAGPSIERQVISMSSSGTLRLELYPPVLYFFTASAIPVELGAASFSVTRPLREIKSQVVKALEAKGLSQGNVTTPHDAIRFWRLPHSDNVKAVPSAAALQEAGVELLLPQTDDATLSDLQIDQPVERIAVETKQGDGTWFFAEDGTPAAATKNVRGIFRNDGGDFLSRLHGSNGNVAAPVATTPEGSASPSSQAVGRVTRSQTAAERGAEKSRGLLGLYNLGNTCFMNSALQCMSNTKELKDYFVSGVYKSEINADNPLGMGGAIAKVFGELLAKLWGAGGGAVHPREFKHVLSRFSPQFIGYAQQDTQELLAFLLDGLHEDLNRIVKKPYVEAPDWEGGGIQEMVAFAHRQWEIYKMRNDSVIVDLFQGQYRSTLVCPDCGKVSIKFDPFMYLTLPIPSRKVITRKVTFISYDEKYSFVTDILLKGDTSVGALKKRVAQIANIEDTSRLLAVDYFQQSFFKVYGDYENAAEINASSDETYIYDTLHAVKPIAPPPASNSAFASHHTVQDLEQKRAPPAEAAAAYAILPVYSLSPQAHHRRNAGHSVGRPFFVAIAADKVNDPAAVQAAVMDKYVHFAEDQDVLRQAVKMSSMRHGKVPSSPEDWDMVDDGRVIIPSMQDQEQQDTIAEIRDEGESVHIVPDTRMDESESKRSAELSRDADDMGKSPLEIIYHVHREGHAPITPKPDGFDTRGEELWARAERLAAAEGQDADSGPGQAQSSSSTPASSPSARWPLVCTGGALVCVWNPDIRERLFGPEDKVSWLSPDENATDPELEAERQTGKKAVKKTLTIDDCLDEFTKEERLGESDPWYCPQCKDFKQASKKFDLWKVPDILVVHLKRFSSGRITRDKIDSVIDFPITELDLTDRVEGAKALHYLHDQDNDGDDKLMESIGSLDANDDAVEADAPIYDLYAVDNHYGGLGGGHYTAYAKNADDEKWYYFDDSSVRPANVEDSKSSAAYLLFYRRRTTRPIGGKSREKVQESVNNSKNNSRAGSEAGDEDSNGAGSSKQPQDGSDDPFMSQHDNTYSAENPVWDTLTGTPLYDDRARLADSSLQYGNDTSFATAPWDNDAEDEQTQDWRAVMDTAEQKKMHVTNADSDDSLSVAHGDDVWTTLPQRRRTPSFGSSLDGGARTDDESHDNSFFRTPPRHTGLSSPVGRLPTRFSSGGINPHAMSDMSHEGRPVTTL